LGRPPSFESFVDWTESDRPREARAGRQDAWEGPRRRRHHREGVVARNCRAPV